MLPLKLLLSTLAGGIVGRTTSTFPVIQEWMLQWYRYVPGLLNVKDGPIKHGGNEIPMHVVNFVKFVAGRSKLKRPVSEVAV